MKRSPIPWEDRVWIPIVGMKIRLREKRKITRQAPDTTAKILEVSSIDNSIRIERFGSRCRFTKLSEKTWKSDWEPEPINPAIEDINKCRGTIDLLSEDDVRRIVREELAARANKVENALRSLLDELFDSVG